MTRFFRTFAIGFLVVSLYFSVLLAFTLVIALPLMQLMGDARIENGYGRFSEYAFDDWINYIAHALIFGGKIGSLFGAIIGHPIGWGVALRRVTPVTAKLAVGLVGAATTWLWFIPLFGVMGLPFDLRDLVSLAVEPLAWVSVLMFVGISGCLVWSSHQKDWWRSSEQ